MGNIAVEPLSRAKIRGRAAFLRNVLGLQGLYIRIDIVLETAFTKVPVQEIRATDLLWRTNWGIFSFIVIKLTSLHGRRGISRPTEIQNGRQIRLRQNSLCHMIKFRA